MMTRANSANDAGADTNLASPLTPAPGHLE